MSIWVRRLSASTLVLLSSSATVVLPLARPPGGRRPRILCTTVFGTCQFAPLGLVPVGRVPAKIVGLFVEKNTGGCERIVALTCTPTLGIMYDAKPRSVVSTGST